MTLSLLRRPKGPLVALTRSPHHPSSPGLFRPLSTLSAINDALRKAHKALPKQSSRSPKLNEDGKPMTYRERQEMRQAMAKPAFKIRKGKKDITFDPVKARPLSRQKRFFDEENSFAKKSLVHQMKTGKFEDQMQDLEKDDGRPQWPGKSRGSSRKREPEERRRERPERSEFSSSSSDPFAQALEGGRREGPERSGSRSRSTKPPNRRAKRAAEKAEKSGFRSGGNSNSFSREPREGRRERPEKSEFRSRSNDSFSREEPSEGRRERPERSEFRSRSNDSFSREEPREGRRERPERSEFRSRSNDSFSRGPRDGRREHTARSESGPRSVDSLNPELQETSNASERTERPARFEYRSGSSSFRGREDRGERERPARFESRSGGGSFRAREDRGERERPARFESRDRRTSSSGDFPTSRAPFRERQGREPPEAPLSIPYTTAASQFLYGQSVVEAAIRTSRRKLYKLYIYAGPGRQKTQADEALRARAEKRGIEVEIISDPRKARLLDQMSNSRPHNGYVLEASPLPQLPVTGLGPYTDPSSPAAAVTSFESSSLTTTTDDSSASSETITPATFHPTPTKPGFSIILGHQSAEEALINGTTTFIPTPSISTTTHHPLVVVLDQILDPGNLGAILRTVSFLGAAAVAITKRSSASLTPIALKASAGAAESIPLFSIDTSLHHFLEQSRTEGNWAVYAAVPETSGGSLKSVQRQVNTYEVEDMDPLAKGPCVLVLGSEGEGLSSQVIQKADFLMSIPNLSNSGGLDGVDSLNVSVAAGLLTSAFMKGSIKEMGSLVKVLEKEKGEVLF